MKKATPLFLLLVSAVGTLQLISAPELIDKKTQRATPFFKKQLVVAGVPLGEPKEHQNPRFEPDHVSNLNVTLQHFCFQKDYEYWKNGGQGRLSIDSKQAREYLKGAYDQYKVQLPDVPENQVDIIIPGGVEATLVKRLRSYTSLVDKKRPHVHRVHFLVRDEETKQSIEHVIKQNEYKPYFDSVQYSITIGDEQDNVLASATQKAKDNGTIAQDYIVISDPVFAEGLRVRLSSVLGKDYTCHGYAHDPIKDPVEDMTLYGYTADKLGSQDAALVAWALSDLNFKARNIHALEQKRIENEK